YINSSGRIQLNTTSTTKYTIVEGIKEIVKNFVMALINLRFVCLMALLLISTTCLTSQVSGRNNIGLQNGICGNREPYQVNCTQQGCVTACKKAGCGGGICHKDGSCNCL
uniref:Knottin scorpion toxin-like domain-containing protein n=2 Tax=Aegilops tauschii subsp. strangulata TaxID=200361 RepID=A0A452YZT9_AEGTS